MSVSLSVIIPAYRSEATVAATLESLRKQKFSGFEVILVDSSPETEVEKVVARFPEVRYVRSGRRMLPHEARMAGVEVARSDLFVFTDPDIVADPAWLTELHEAYSARKQPIAGAVCGLDRDWREIAIHLAKFDLWLPRHGVASLPIAASVNFLCDRQMLTKAGGFDGAEMIGDTLLSWALIKSGYQIAFAPGAIVNHDHQSSVRQLMRERFLRGADFGRLRMRREGWSRPRTAGVLLATIFPLRLVKLVARTGACARAAHVWGRFLSTLPVVIAGHAAWLTGESSQYLRRLGQRSNGTS